MARSPWSKPKHAPRASARELEAARKLASEVQPSMRVGAKTGLREHIIAGINARLTDGQLVKVEFVQLRPAEIDEMIAAIEAGTSSVCVLQHGKTATFFRRHPERTFP